VIEALLVVVVCNLYGNSVSTDLKIKGTRLITINKTGNVETQFYSLYPTEFTAEINKLIVNSNEPFDEWCKYIRRDYNINDIVYIWDLEDNYNVPEIVERERAFYEELNEIASPEDIVRYEIRSEYIINEITQDIQELIDRSWDFEWVLE
jgi:hypothetical protein